MTCLSLVQDEGPPISKTVMTGVRDRIVNMHAFTHEALKLLHESLLRMKDQSKL